VLAGKRGVKKSPIETGLFISLVHEASLREPFLPAPPDAVGRFNVVYMAANPREVDRHNAGGRLWAAVSSASEIALSGRGLPNVTGRAISDAASPSQLKSSSKVIGQFSSG
jgi:hypothetical protein